MARIGLFAPSVVAVVVAAIGCSSSSSSAGGPCALRGGAYLLTWTVRDGNCGAINDQVVNVAETQKDVGATGAPAAPCTGKVVNAADNCSTMVENQTCPEPGSGGSSVANGKVDWAEDGSGGTAQFSFTGYGAKGAVLCQGTYDVRYTRQ